MDIREIFRIWTQGAKGYTVSDMDRLFHAFQTRRGGGLRSRSASWFIMRPQEQQIDNRKMSINLLLCIIHEENALISNSIVIFSKLCGRT